MRIRQRQAGLAGSVALLAAVMAAVQQPKTGVLYNCDEGNQARVTRCANSRCDVELGPPGRLTPYMTLSVAGTNSFLRSQGCVDPEGKAVSGPPAIVSKPVGTSTRPSAAPTSEATPASTVKTACKVDGPSATRPRGAASSTLSVAGTGYRYMYEERNKKTGEVTESFSETGNFINTHLYLLDEDADVVLQRAGVETGIFQTRYEMLAFYDGGTQVENTPGMTSITALFGHAGLGQEISRDAKADFDCVMASIRAHTVAELTTDAMARGTFPAVPSGVYHLFGRFYRLEKPVRRGGVMWNTKVQPVPGANRRELSIGEAVWTGR